MLPQSQMDQNILAEKSGRVCVVRHRKCRTQRGDGDQAATVASPLFSTTTSRSTTRARKETWLPPYEAQEQEAAPAEGPWTRTKPFWASAGRTRKARSKTRASSRATEGFPVFDIWDPSRVADHLATPRGRAKSATTTRHTCDGDEIDPAEARGRMDEAVKRMLSMPPETHYEMVERCRGQTVPNQTKKPLLRSKVHLSSAPLVPKGRARQHTKGV